MDRRQLFFFPSQPEKIKDTKDDLNKGRTRCRQTDLEQGNRKPLACQIGNWNPHEEGADQSLEHDESRLAAAVEIADEAEHKRYQQRVDRISFQIIGGRQDHLRISGEQSGKQIAMEKGEIAHKDSEQ